MGRPPRSSHGDPGQIRALTKSMPQPAKNACCRWFDISKRNKRNISMKQKAHTRSSHLPATTWMLRKPQLVSADHRDFTIFFFFFFFLAGDGFEPVMMGPSS